jgi:hypothetical protein
VLGAHTPTVLTADHPLARRPAPPFRRMTCMFCAHTFRPGETVIICPCSPGAPQCDAAVHRDPSRGLVCWESWHSGQRVKVCPVLLVRREE